MELGDREKQQLATVAKYQKVFSGPDGETVLEDMKKSFFFGTTTFTGDANMTIYKEGQRSVILAIMKMVQTDVAQLRERMIANAEKK